MPRYTRGWLRGRQGFSLLTANRRELARPEVLDVAERTGVSVPAIVFRFARELGRLPLTSTTNTEHLRADLASDQVVLTADDVRVIERISG